MWHAMLPPPQPETPLTPLRAGGPTPPTSMLLEAFTANMAFVVGTILRDSASDDFVKYMDQWRGLFEKTDFVNWSFWTNPKPHHGQADAVPLVMSIVIEALKSEFGAAWCHTIHSSGFASLVGICMRDAGHLWPTLETLRRHHYALPPK